MKGKPDCGACIEEYGVRHTMGRMSYADNSGNTVFLCDYHDLPGQDTLKTLDPFGALPTKPLDGRSTE